MKIAISTDSSADMPISVQQEYNIHITPLTILMDEEIFLDGERPITDIFDYVNKTKNLPKTSAVNEEQYKTHFSKLLESYDSIIHISMASFTSCSYENAMSASKYCNNVHVIDSKSLSSGMTLLATIASKLACSGSSVEQIINEINKLIPKTQVSLILKSVNYLHKGGRCSGLALLGANLLNLKPMVVLEDDKVKVKKKLRGNMQKVLKDYINELFITHPNPNIDDVYIAYTSTTPELVEIARNLLKTRGFKNIHTAVANATITCHCGEYAMGIIFIDN